MSGLGSDGLLVPSCLCWTPEQNLYCSKRVFSCNYKSFWITAPDKCWKYKCKWGLYTDFSLVQQCRARNLTHSCFHWSYLLMMGFIETVIHDGFIFQFYPYTSTSMVFITSLKYFCGVCVLQQLNAVIAASASVKSSPKLKKMLEVSFF